jgi:hypothetical protein
VNPPIPLFPLPFGAGFLGAAFLAAFFAAGRFFFEAGAAFFAFFAMINLPMFAPFLLRSRNHFSSQFFGRLRELIINRQGAWPSLSARRSPCEPAPLRHIERQRSPVTMLGTSTFTASRHVYRFHRGK